MELKKCPYCGKSILAIAKVCKHCGQSLAPQEESTPKQETVLEEPTVQNNYEQQKVYNSYTEETQQQVENLSGFQYFKKCLKHYAVFNGRARRKEFWMFVLFNMIFAIAAATLDNIIGTADYDGFGLFYYIYCLAMLLPSLAVLVRRMHDIGKSGWWFFISLIPLIGGIILLVFCCTAGNVGENRYGKSPK